MKPSAIELEEKENLISSPAAIDSKESARASAKSDSVNRIIKELKEEFEALTKISNDKEAWDKLEEKDQVENDREKLEIMQAVYENIQKKYGPPNKELEPKREVKEETAIWRHVVFFVLIVLEVIVLSVGGYLGSVSLIQMMAPGLTTVMVSVIALIATAIEGLMLYSILKPWLQQGLEIKPEKPRETLAKSYGDRLALMEKMNTLMVNNLHYTQEKGHETYAEYTDMLKAFNADMAKIKLTPYKESLAKKITRYGLTLINIGLSIAATYFAAAVLLTSVSAALLGTPAGWAIIATAIVVQLAAKFLIRKSSVYALINPGAEQYEETREKLNKFVDKTDGINQDLNTIKKLNELKRIKDKEKLLKPSEEKLIHSIEYPFFQRKPKDKKDKVVVDLKGPARAVKRRMSFS